MPEISYNTEIDSIVLQRMNAVNRREMKDLWTKQVPETKYLSADHNVARYRLVMRYFYESYSKLKYWLRPEEVHEGVCRWELLEEYTLEQCQRDLEVLSEWRNLTSRHDGGRATTIEEYLRKRFRYQMTPYSIEIERMLAGLEQLQGYGGSLEPTFLERLAGYVQHIRTADRFAQGEALLLWRDLQTHFKQLHENASDYLASLQTGKAEELMLTEQFLIYKDTLTHYLRNFIVSLQKHGAAIEETFRTTPAERWDAFLQAVAEDESRLPTLDGSTEPEERRERLREEWNIFGQWFVGTDIEKSEITNLERETKNSIGKMLKAALAIQERTKWGVSRKKELDYLGKWFFRFDDVEDAHKLAAYTFGLFRTRHFQGEGERSTDSGDLPMWDEAPIVRELRSRSRTRTKAGEPEAVKDRKEAQRTVREAYLAQKAWEDEVLRRWHERGDFQLSELERMTPLERELLLSWLSRCLASRSRAAKTPDGYEIRLSLPDGAERTKRTVLEFADGELELPDYRVTVREVTA